MQQVKNLILNFLLLILGISLNLYSDISYKQCKFFETLLEKGLKFVLSKRDDILTFNLGLMLLPSEIDPIVEKQGRKKDAWVACGTGDIKMVFVLLIKIIALYI